MHLSVLLWAGIGIVVIGFGVVLFFRAASSKDLGPVSGEWIAEHHRESD